MQSGKDNNGIPLYIYFLSLFLKTNYFGHFLGCHYCLYCIKVKLKGALNFIHFQPREHFYYTVEGIGCVCLKYLKWNFNVTVLSCISL